MTGLSSEEVKLRTENGLVNYDISVKTKTISQIIKSKIFTLFNFLNFFLAGLILFTHSYKNMAFMGVVTWNILIGTIQEIRAKQLVDKLSLLSSKKARVIRNSTEEEISIYDIVLDDILILNAGNQIPVDSVILKGFCLVNESMITGESESVLKKENDTLLSGSYIVSGKVYVKVIHVAKDTYVNQITSNAKYIKKPNSQIISSLNSIIKTITICIIPTGVILFIKQYYEAYSIDNAIISTVAAMISMIPSGLVLLTSIVLTVSVIRLAKYNALVEDMYCIETLSLIDTICLDKTGTITTGEMQVEDIEFLTDYDESKFRQIMKKFIFSIDDNNQTATAIKEYFKNENEYEIDVKKIVPFSSETKTSMVIFEDNTKVILGAPEFVINNISNELSDKLNKYLSLGNRVLCLMINGEAVALISLLDLIREDAKETLEFFEQNSVNVKIISGDNPYTVANISKKLDIKGYDKYIDFSKLESNADISKIVEEYTIFGRVSPSQKLDIIKALKENKHTVAMVGDGANDVMALKEADCSIAIKSGSDAARCVSQILLLDSKFFAIPQIVDEGRRTINNIERSSVLYLSKTVYAILLALIFIFVDARYPFIPIQLTLIGALTIGIPSFVLALEPNHDIVRGTFLTNVLRKAIPGGLIVVLNVMLGIILANKLNLNYSDASTICTILTGISGMIVLKDVCSPFNLKRGLLYAFLIGSLLIALVCFKNLFGINKLNKDLCMIILMICIMTYFLHKLLIMIFVKKCRTLDEQK